MPGKGVTMDELWKLVDTVADDATPAVRKMIFRVILSAYWYGYRSAGEDVASKSKEVQGWIEKGEI